MKVVLKRSADPTTAKADLLVVPVAKPAAIARRSPLAALDAALNGVVKGAISDGEINGAVGAWTVFHTRGALTAPRLMLVGVGDADVESWRDAAQSAGARARDLGARTVMALCDDGDSDRATAFAEGFAMGNYRFTRYRTGDDATPQAALTVVTDALRAKDGARLSAITTAVSAARDLVNTPAGDLTPTAMADRARALAAAHPTLSCRVLGPAELRRLKAGAFLAVAQGSAQPPAMIVLRHTPTRDRGRGEVLGLVGKGVTFDTGGISIKPSGGMEEMKMDMAGGAAVIEAMGLIAALDVSVPVVGVVGATENMPSGTAVKPGDVVRAMNGRTIEVINTDAEGRMVLADCLTYAATKAKATRLVDFATLTGAMVVALGEIYAGAFSDNDDWGAAVRDAGSAAGDLCWPMPMHRRYDGLIRSAVADLSNSANRKYAPGAIYAAQFLREFTEGLPWCHLDIAGTGMLSSGGTGFGVGLSLRLAESMVRPGR